jgi:dephospho-CoA kinase
MLREAQARQTAARSRKLALGWLGVHVFGLTGGFASGKSTVAARFRARGVPVIDADVLARAAVLPGSEGLRAVTKVFGEDLVKANGELDRKALGARVFGDSSARQRLEAILHPRIRALMHEQKATLEAQGELVACYEAPLLIEVGLSDELRPLVVVTTSLDEQLRRAQARDGLSESAVKARLDAQISLAEKVQRADIVVDNSGTLEQLNERADEALDRVLTTLGIPIARYPRPRA